jgi:Arm DNA-binding domain
MYLWVTPTGGRSWRWTYRFDGKQKLMTLGPYPEISLAAARERHAEGRKLLANGIDPMEQRKADKTAERLATENSFAAVATQWLDHWRVGKSPRHAEYTDRNAGFNHLRYLDDIRIFCKK